MPVTRQLGSVKDRFKPQEPKDQSPVGRLRGKDVKENTPPQKQDSKDEEEEETEEQQYRWGRAQNLSSFWSNVKDDAKVVKRNIQLDMNGEPIVLESEPVELEGVVKSTTDPSADRQVDLESGHTAKLASRFLKFQEDSAKTRRSKKFQMDLADEGPVILENEPEQREDVVRYDEQREDVIPGASGRTRAFAERFSNWKEDEHKVKRAIEIERAPGACVIENEPEERDDVVKSGGPSGWEIDYDAFAGKTSSLLSQWKQNIEGDSSSDNDTLPRRKDKPFWLQEIAAARDSKDVYENDPDELEGVVREQDVNPDETQVNLKAGHAKNLRSMWASREQNLAEEEARKTAEKGQVIRRKKIHPEPEPEPEPEPVKTDRRNLVGKNRFAIGIDKPLRRSNQPEKNAPAKKEEEVYEKKVVFKDGRRMVIQKKVTKVEEPVKEPPKQDKVPKKLSDDSWIKKRR